MNQQDREFLNEFKEALLSKIQGNNEALKGLSRIVENIEKRTAQNTVQIATLESEVNALKCSSEKECEDERGEKIIEAQWKDKMQGEIKSIWFYIGKVIGFNTLAGALAGGIVAAIVGAIFK